MKNAFLNTWLRAGSLALALCCSVPVNGQVTIGPNPEGASIISNYDLVALSNAGGFIGTNADPIDVTLGAAAGSWVMEFTATPPYPWGGGIAYLGETLRVNSADTWSGWVMELTTPGGWTFQPNSFGFLVGGNAPTNLVSTLNATNRRVEFTFDPFTLPMMVQIAWGFVCPGAPGSCAESFTLAQSPLLTPIPEPEIYTLMGIGLGLLGWVGRKKKLHAAA